MCLRTHTWRSRRNLAPLFIYQSKIRFLSRCSNILTTKKSSNHRDFQWLLLFCYGLISLYVISFPHPYPAIIFLPYPDALSLPFSLPASPLWKFSPLNVPPLSLTFHCSEHYRSYYNCFLQAPPPLQVVYIPTAFCYFIIKPFIQNKQLIISNPFSVFGKLSKIFSEIFKVSHQIRHSYVHNSVSLFTCLNSKCTYCSCQLPWLSAHR